MIGKTAAEHTQGMWFECIPCPYAKYGCGFNAKRMTMKFEIAKITTFMKIIPHEKYPLYILYTVYANASARKSATPRIVQVRSVLVLVASVGIVLDEAEVVDNRLVLSGASLCFKRRKLIAGKSEN